MRQGQASDLPKITQHVDNQMGMKISSPFLLPFRVPIQGITLPSSVSRQMLMFCYFSVIFNGKGDLAVFGFNLKDAGKVRLIFWS